MKTSNTKRAFFPLFLTTIVLIGASTGAVIVYAQDTTQDVNAFTNDVNTGLITANRDDQIATLSFETEQAASIILPTDPTQAATIAPAPTVDSLDEADALTSEDASQMNSIQDDTNAPPLDPSIADIPNADNISSQDEDHIDQVLAAPTSEDEAKPTSDSTQQTGEVPDQPPVDQVTDQPLDNTTPLETPDSNSFPAPDQTTDQPPLTN